jgi:hypothetical protein
MTEGQHNHLVDMINIIEKETGTKVTKSSLVLRLIEFGQPSLEKLYPKAFLLEQEAEIEFIDDNVGNDQQEKKKKFFFFN